jgi:type VI secretion system FHA domain protein
MHELGQILREYTRGTIDLLIARGALKKEVRADVTMMASNANNVLKFSPTVEFALQHLLGTPTPGFMGSLASLEDAFEDLKSHQLGVMAGMHAALQGVLKRFDPVEIERKVGTQGGLFNLVPSSRKAKLWELFQEMYGQSASQAREEFDELFGKAFAREYDRFISELQSK